MQRFNRGHRDKTEPEGLRVLKLRQAMPNIGMIDAMLITERNNSTLEDKICGATLHSGTKVRSIFEEVMKCAFLAEGCRVMYEPFSFPLQGNGSAERMYTYTPDFIMLEYMMGGRPIAIEPHNPDLISIKYLDKLKKAEDKYGLYVVLCTSDTFYDTRQYSEKTMKRVSEWWSVGRDRHGFIKVGNVVDNIRSIVQRAERAEGRQVAMLLRERLGVQR